jgi:hypothetical protein
MKISNDIKVGVDAPGMCQFWSTIKEYQGELLKQYPVLENETLIGLSAHMNESGKLSQIYFVEKPNWKVEMYVLTIDKDGKNRQWLPKLFRDSSELEQIMALRKHVLDLNYYLKNN